MMDDGDERGWFGSSEYQELREGPPESGQRPAS
jgi:hypothetical protein